MVNSQIIWDAYRHFHSYVTWPIGQSKSSLQKTIANPPTVLVVQSSVPPKTLPPWPIGKQIQAAETIAGQVRDVIASTTVGDLPTGEAVYTSADDLYLSYLYLWSQYLRISYPYHPLHMPGVGWYNLAWRPLTHIVGRQGEDNARRAWRHFLFTYWTRLPSHERRLADLEALFPLLIAPRTLAGSKEDLVVKTLFTCMKAWKYSAAEVFEWFDATGTPRGDVLHPQPWPIQLICARPEAWTPVQSPQGKWSAGLAFRCKETRKLVIELLTGPKKHFLTYFQDYVPKVNPDEPIGDVHESIRQGLDELLQEIGDAKLTAAFAARWLLLYPESSATFIEDHRALASQEGGTQ